jgi:cellulose synthase/poly-beta-1,6-N-acetylglucosamine synthase-like glycosyltransferase
VDATVIVATFGDPKWVALAKDRAVPSAESQGVPVIQYHGDTLAQARNFAASQADTEWLCFLDADDELAPGYFRAMERSSADLRAPSVSWVTDGVASEPQSLAGRNIRVMNPCVIGTLIRKDMFDNVGGFWEERAYEDWSLFRRAWLRGARVGHVNDAVYIVHVSPNSRNNSIEDPMGLCREIKMSHKLWRWGR